MAESDEPVFEVVEKLKVGDRLLQTWQEAVQRDVALPGLDLLSLACEPNDMLRDQAMLHALASTHTILGVEKGEFYSLIDPPDAFREQAAGCRNEGTWPVLVGREGETDTMLSSPITLYDYPQVAAESPGEFFDGTEIDEMLVLRTLTLTDAERQAAVAVDERVRALLTRTGSLSDEQIMSLHGTIRGLRPLPAGEST
jgi:hydrogenase maturation protease